MKKITWKETMNFAMTLAKEACEANIDWTKCIECPFEKYCDCITRNFDGMIPAEFEIEEEGE